MRKRFRNGALLLLVALAAPFAPAQTPATPDPEEEIVRFDFRTYPVVSRTPRGLFYRTEEGEFAPLRFRPFERSIRTYSYEGPPAFALFRQAGTDAEPEWEAVARAAAPEGRGPFLLFVLPPDAATAEAGYEFRLEFIEDSPEALPPDTVSFLNFTNVPLIGVFDISEINLPPGLTGPIPLAGKLGDPLLVGLAIRNADTLRKVLQNRWTFYPNHRNLILLLPPDGRGGLRIRAYQLSEFVPGSGESGTSGNPPTGD